MTPLKKNVVERAGQHTHTHSKRACEFSKVAVFIAFRRFKLMWGILAGLCNSSKKNLKSSQGRQFNNYCQFLAYLES